MSGHENSQLRQLQQGTDNLSSRGLSTLGMNGGLERTYAGNVGNRQQWRYLVYLVIALLVGVLLADTPWLPGLGPFVIMGVVVAAIPVALPAWMGKSHRLGAPFAVILCTAAVSAGCGLGADEPAPTTGSSSAATSGARSGGPGPGESATAGTVAGPGASVLRSWAPSLFQATEYGLADSESAWEEIVSYGSELPWQYVRAAGVTQAAACTGSGSPTVVISNGMSGESTMDSSAWIWPEVVKAVAESNRVCLFDRPGTGLSIIRPDTAAPNGPVANAAEMFALLEALGEPEPYVVTGWSYGGAVATTAAASRPDGVAGMVLVDPVTLADLRTYGDPESWWEGGANLDMEAAAKATSDLALGDKPVVVLRAGKAQEGMPKGYMAAHAKALKRLARNVSDNSLYATVTDSEHPIPLQDPQAVAAAITAVAQSATAGNSELPPCPGPLAGLAVAC